MVSCTVPKTSPGPTSSPTFTEGENFHFFSLSRAGTAIPRVILLPTASYIPLRGLCIPSYIVSIRPGPSSTESGAPVVTTGAPGPIPAVSSYT